MMNYETRLKQMDARRADIAARYSKATQKARNDAIFTAGKMVVEMFPDWRGIKWKNLEKIFTNDANVDNFRKTCYTEDFEVGEPHKNLKKYKDGKKAEHNSTCL